MQHYPNSIVMIRHGESEVNLDVAQRIPEYAEFRDRYDLEYAQASVERYTKGLFPSVRLSELARRVVEKMPDPISDFDIPLTDLGWQQSRETGQQLRRRVALPKQIYLSPYRRVRETLAGIIEGWPELGGVSRIEDGLLREKKNGVCELYHGNWRLSNVFHPEDALRFKSAGYYKFNYTGGESLLEVRDRVRNFIAEVLAIHAGQPRTLRDYVCEAVDDYSRGGLWSALRALEIKPDTKPEDIMVVSHGIAILAMRANLEGWGEDDFMIEHRQHPPVNCGVTMYSGGKGLGDRHPVLSGVFNNTQLWKGSL